MSKSFTEKLEETMRELEDPNSEASKRLNKYCKKIMKREEKKAQFFESKKFKKYLKEIKRHDNINEEGLRYKTCPNVKLTAKQFMKVHDAIWLALNHKIKVIDDDYFPIYRIKYKGFK